MRVAFDARSLRSKALRGWDRYTIGLVRELTRRGVEVTLFHRAREALNPEFVSDLGCRILGLEDRGGLYWEQVAVPVALWRGKFDLFHAPAERGVPVAAPCPVVLTIHSVTALSYAELIRRGDLQGTLSDYLGFESSRWSFVSLYWRAQVARANHIFTPSDFSCGEIVKLLGIPVERVSVTRLAVDDQFKRRASSPEVRDSVLKRLGICRPYLLYVGGYEPHKNVAGLLQTFKLVGAVRPDLLLVLAGTKALPAGLLALVKRLGPDVESKVVFLIDVTDTLLDLYDGAEALVTLSWRETFCLPALEAMARGIPVVASRWGAASEIMDGNGRLVDPRNIEDAQNAILDLLSDNCRENRERGRQRATEFTWAETAAQTIAVYQSLIKAES